VQERRSAPTKSLPFLGVAAWGEVYAARDPRLSPTVPLKVLSVGDAADQSQISRFRREAQAVASLSHPNIVTIYSVEEASGLPFVTMELVKGRNLDVLVETGGMALDRLLRLASPRSPRWLSTAIDTSCGGQLL